MQNILSHVKQKDYFIELKLVDNYNSWSRDSRKIFYEAFVSFST